MASRRAVAAPRRAPDVRLLLACIGVALPPFMLLVALQPPLWLGEPTPRPVVIEGGASTLGWLGFAVTLGFIVFLCLPYQPYGVALRLLDACSVRRRTLIGTTLVIAAVGVLIYPHFGSDVFDYAAYERLWVTYGDNPLQAIVANHPDDWLAPFVNVPDRTPAYGPLWALLTWPIVRLAADSSLGLVIGYKLLSLAAYAACCWLIWASVEPSRRQRAVVMFAWSPLVIFEVLGKLHNDSLLALSLLAVVWLLGRNAATRGWLTLVAGGLVKATALVAAPVLALQTFRQAGWRGLLRLAMADAVLTLLAYLPFWNGLETMAPIWRQTSGLGFSVTTVLTVATSSQMSDAAALPVRAVLAVAWACITTVLLPRRRLDQPAEVAATTGWVLIATLVLLTGAIYGHYFVPIVALAAVSGEVLLERVATWLSIGGLALYAVGPIGWTIDPAWIGTLSYQVTGAVIVFGPVTFGMLVLLARHRRQNLVAVTGRPQRQILVRGD